MKEYYEINGGKTLKGEVQLSGAKNLANKLIIASILTPEEVILENVPRIGEIQIATDISNKLGSKTKFSKNIPTRR